MTVLPVRRLLVGLGLIFAVYLAVRGLMWTAVPTVPVVYVGALALGVISTAICLFADSLVPAAYPDAPLTAGNRGPSKLPVWAAVLAVATAAIVPTAVSLSVGESHRADSWATSYVGLIGALLTVTTVRRRPGFAWIGTAALAAGTIAWLGPIVALGQGLTGSVMWIVGAQLLIGFLDRAARDTVRLVELQRAAVAWQAVQETRRRERRVRVRFALQVAAPILVRVIQSGGDLTAEERAQARLAEGSLRDELRGARLLDDRVRAELDSARRRGSTITVFDEGGLDGLDQQSLDRIRGELADIVSGTIASRLIIRTARDPRVAVTVVGRMDESDDEDSVVLWKEIPRQRVAAEESQRVRD